MRVELVLAVVAVTVLRRYWRRDSGALDGGDLIAQADFGEKQAHVVGGAALWLGILDDLDEGRNDRGVELRPRVGL